MKSSRIVLILSLFLQGCWVCEKSYNTEAEIKSNKPLFRKDSLNMSCYLNLDNDKDLTINVWFDKDNHSEKINDMTIKIISSDSADIKLDYVRMLPLSQGNDARFREEFKKDRFEDLPDKYRFTVVNNEIVDYTFDFKSKKNIKSKSLIISILIILPNKKISITETFYLQKRCYFSVH